MEKKKRRISLSAKLYLLITAIILVLSFGLTLTSYQTYSKKVYSNTYSEVDRIAEAACSIIPGEYIANLRRCINTEEFSQIRQEATDAGDERILIDWMKKQPSAVQDPSADPYALFSTEIDREEASLYDDYTALMEICYEFTRLFEVKDTYIQYMDQGVTYSLLDPEAGLLGTGYVEPPLKEFSSYSDNEEFPPTVYKSEWGWLCTVGKTVYLADEKTAAGMICVDADMNNVMKERSRFLGDILLLIVFELIAAHVISMILVRFAVIRPMKMLTEATRAFGNENEQYTKEDVVQLPIRSNDEIGELYHEIQSMQTRIVDYTDNIARITAERERVGAELKMATEIQASAIPAIFPAFPERPEFDLFASMTPAKEVGGDFYDFFLIDEDHLCILIADVSDKGIPAALFMMSSKILINYRAREGGTPAEIFAAVNKQLSLDNQSKMFVTVWLGILELSTGRLICSNAGHENPMIRGADGVFQIFEDKHGLMLGAIRKAKYTDYEMILKPGDSVFVYTDGVPEANNAEGEFYSVERLESALNAERGATPHRILENVSNDVERFTGSADQFDDLTMLCLLYRGPKLEVDAVHENLGRVLEYADAQMELVDYPADLRMTVSVAIEEVFVNICNYAYEGETGRVSLYSKIQKEPRALVFTFLDSGIPYDPVAKEDPDISIPLKERKIGGLGIFMTKGIMDEVLYEYRDGKNILTLKKYL